jgi:glucuronate isomerase
MKVRLVCTTDDPVDSLEHHKTVKVDKGFDIQMLPAWRPDKAMDVDGSLGYNTNGYVPYLDKLAAAANIDINNYDAFWEALGKRLAFFVEMGCRASDHGLETIDAEETSEAEAKKLFAKARGGEKLSAAEAKALRSDMLYRIGVMEHGAGLRQQFHLGAIRNNNSRLYKRLGPDQGFDSIGDFGHARPLAKFLDRLDRDNRLAPTILYNINPADNELFATMLGNFQDGTMPGKMQWGSGWWFMDQLDGMERQINALSLMGLLGRFVGMITDSRSFLSYTRHEYFRRLLCNMLGSDVERGLIPGDDALIAPLLRNICYNNAVEFFGFNLPKIEK